MKQEEIEKLVKDILTNSNTGTMATVKDNKPYSRYMNYINEDFTLYTATSKKTDKVEELDGNPYTHILLGYDGEGFGDSYVEYQGKVAIKDDEQLKEALWNEHMSVWFDGPNDPNLVVLEITPVQISLMNKKGVPSEISLEW